MTLSLEQQLFQLLGAGDRGTIATAESCTGGNVAARITSVAGSSAYMLGGIVAYANSAKEHLLGVDRAILEQHGAVSEACATAMAEGARKAFGATWAVSTTGIAGPGGATATKPVGLVYVAVVGPETISCQEHVWAGGRESVTAAATLTALRMLVAMIG